jgi:hypothetical protein
MDFVLYRCHFFFDSDCHKDFISMNDILKNQILRFVKYMLKNPKEKGYFYAIKSMIFKYSLEKLSKENDKFNMLFHLYNCGLDTFVINNNKKGEQESITCLVCGLTRCWNLGDIGNLYCEECKIFHGDMSSLVMQITNPSLRE